MSFETHCPSKRKLIVVYETSLWPKFNQASSCWDNVTRVKCASLKNIQIIGPLNAGQCHCVPREY